LADISNSRLFNATKGTLPKGAFVVIVRTEWNAEIVDRLEEGCQRVLKENGIKVEVVNVPGAFEIPFAVQHYWRKAKKAGKAPHAFVSLGCVLRGGTPHFEYVCKAVTDGVVQLNLTLPVPVIFGVLTLDNQQQADERTGGVHGHKGEEAGITAVKMMSLFEKTKTGKGSRKV